MLRDGVADISNGKCDVVQPVASSSKTGLAHPFPSPSSLTSLPSTTLGDLLDSGDPKVQPPSKKKRGKNNSKRRANKASKWADRCMYAELLEMCTDEPWSRGDIDDAYGNTFEDYERVDGLPRDLETGWVAVAPVPVGKRCLAVTQQSAGVAGVGTLFSSLLFLVLPHS
jgi:snurportin-1